MTGRSAPIKIQQLNACPECGGHAISIYDVVRIVHSYRCRFLLELVRLTRVMDERNAALCNSSMPE